MSAVVDRARLSKGVEAGF